MNNYITFKEEIGVRVKYYRRVGKIESCTGYKFGVGII